MKTVIIGQVGTRKDAPAGEESSTHWRPSVALCQRDDLRVDRFELLHERGFATLAEVVAADIRKVSPETEVRLHELDTRDPWDFEDVFATLHDFARRYAFKPDEEQYLVHVNNGTHVVRICLFLLTESRHFPARLIQSVAPDAPGHMGSYRIIDLDLSRYDRIAQRFAAERRDSVTVLKSGVATKSKRFNELISQIERVAVAAPVPILLTGPTGAGKSRLARQIYALRKQRKRVSGRFVEVNCATIRGDAAMSTLFGHVKGAFTGAVSDRPGLLRAADQGILFLDEIGELGPDEQAMLLRAVEEKTFLPLGADREVTSDFQLIAGTNRDLATERRAGRFREDLLARIDLWTFELPGLAERPQDIEPNLDDELERLTGVIGVRTTMSAEARRLFLVFARSPEARWTRNFRDLNGAIFRMATLAEQGRIKPSTVGDEIERLRRAWRPDCADGEDDLVLQVLGRERAERLDLFDRLQLAGVLRVCRNSRSLADAGRTLFAVSRAARQSTNDSHRLRVFLMRFGIDWRDVMGVKTTSSG